MLPRPAPPSITVIGGGVAGLLAARRLAAAGAKVVLLERTATLGGQIRTLVLDGRPVDVGAEAVHLALPAMRGIVDELALDSTVQGSRPGTTWLWNGRRRVLPAGVGPAGPTRIAPVLRSRVLGPRALIRAGLEPLVARRAGPIDLSAGQDVPVGAFVASRFGRAVSDLFVDPLLGSLHSGDVNQLSLRACAPALVPAAIAGRSLLARRPPAPPARNGQAPVPMFACWPGGLRTLTDALIEGTGVHVRLGAQVTGLRRLPPGGKRPGGDGALPDGGPSGGGYEITLAGGERLLADGVVLAVPAAVSAGLVAPGCPQAASTLRLTQVASTATIVLAFRREQVAHLPALAGNGFLIPSRFATLIKAGTHLSAKWAHLDDGQTTLYRVSAGRAGQDLLGQLGDEEVVARARRELAMVTGIEAAPVLAHVERWPAGLPQLTVGHPDRIAAVRAGLAAQLPGVELAGASYDGIGIGACLASADRAAARLLDRLSSAAPEVTAG